MEISSGSLQFAFVIYFDSGWCGYMAAKNNKVSESGGTNQRFLRSDMVPRTSMHHRDEAF